MGLSIEKEQANSSPKKLSDIEYIKSAIAISGNELEFANFWNGVNGKPFTVSAGKGRSFDLACLTGNNLSTVKRIEAARNYYESDDLLSSLIDFKTEMTIAGYKIQCKPEENSMFDLVMDSVDIKDGGVKIEHELALEGEIPKGLIDFVSGLKSTEPKVRSLTLEHDLTKVANDLATDWFITDNMILHWRVKDGVLVTVDTLDADSIVYDNSVAGSETVSYKIPEEVTEAVNSMKHAMRYNRSDPEVMLIAVKKELLEKFQYPEDWVEAAWNGDDSVPLSESNGDYWIVVTKAKKFKGLACPGMFNIFPYLKIRELIKDGEVSAAWMMKHFIFHAKIGESIDSGPLAGQRLNWAEESDIKNLFSKIATAEQAARLVTNHTVEFEYIFPPKDIWDTAKYDSCEKAIHNFTGVNTVIHTGEGGGKSGHIGTKRLVTQILHARSRITFLFEKMLSHKSMESIFKCPEGSYPSVVFDNQVLKEQRLKLQEAQFLTEAGFGDPDTVLKELDRDPNNLLLRKVSSMIINNKTTVYSPLNAFINRAFGGSQPPASQGDVTLEQGRPPNDSTVKSEGTRSQSSGDT